MRSLKTVALWIATFGTVFVISKLMIDKFSNSSDSEQKNSSIERENTIYVITPTYGRPQQKAELTRFANTILHVKNLHWIVVEDAPERGNMVTSFLQRLSNLASTRNKMKITHLFAETPKGFRNKAQDPSWLRPKGFNQRNEGLRWLRKNGDEIDQNGVVYFADDDNTYDIAIFDEMRDTKKVSCWPVGLVGGLLVERPIVDDDGKVVSFNSVWKPERLYPIDMASFAINVQLLLVHSNAYFTPKLARGFQESYILKQLISGPEEMEPKANMCTLVLVWHTRTAKPNLEQEAKLKVPSTVGISL
ncbi:galactosylgalactosylxylosylprotein 3-beta-glucuronosyltransferase sqv-8-like [Brevipalpus obovatus]|uniref:galactosylgalactosylxylosylprotein 3-beta-glucuronosyltransferase sqv-8-like n=1 Tax=Brevipalpus obovatus TaxID=246614 RepID=UPI003D9F1A67